jgi:hypothetical protein
LKATRLAALAVVSLAIASGWAITRPSGARDASPLARGAEPTIVEGRFVNGENEPLVGLRVLLYLTPPTSSRSRVRDRLVASSTTDEKGGFSLDAGNSSLLRKLGRSNDGWLNLDLLAGTSQLYLYRSLPRKFVRKGWTGTADARGSVDLGAVILAPGQPGVGPRKASFRIRPARRPQSAVGAAACTQSSSVQLGRTLYTLIGELHNVDASARLSYGRTSDSVIDAAVSFGSSSSSWSVSGTTMIANTRVSPVSKAVTGVYRRRLRSLFRYERRLIFNTCTGSRRTIKAVRWSGSMTDGGPAPDPSSHCTVGPYNTAPRHSSFAAGTSFTRSVNLAFRYPKAVDLSPSTAFSAGIALGARSGYSARVRARWSFVAAGGLCGDTAAPGASKRIFAGS